MSHTRPWPFLSPSPNRPSNEADDAIRELRVDIEERMAHLLPGIGNWTADPIVAPAFTRYMFMHYSQFRPFGQLFGAAAGTAAGKISGTEFNGGVRIVGSGSLTLQADIQIPVGSTIVDIDLLGVTAANTSIVGNILKLNAVIPPYTLTTLATRTIAASTAQGTFSLSSGADIDYEIVEGDFIHATIVLSNTNVGNADFGFQGLRVHYFAPALRYV